MQRFDCPSCGPRDQAEFVYGREVAAIPALDASAAVWLAYVYDRDNPCGPHAEWWQHVHGCRQWLVIVRDTLTHRVLSIASARDFARGGGLDSRAGSIDSAGPT